MRKNACTDDGIVLGSNEGKAQPHSEGRSLLVRTHKKPGLVIAWVLLGILSIPSKWWPGSQPTPSGTPGQCYGVHHSPSMVQEEHDTPSREENAWVGHGQLQGHGREMGGRELASLSSYIYITLYIRQFLLLSLWC